MSAQRTERASPYGAVGCGSSCSHFSYSQIAPRLTRPAAESLKLGRGSWAPIRRGGELPFLPGVVGKRLC